jgi:NAD(P)H-flavin reductase
MIETAAGLIAQVNITISRDKRTWRITKGGVTGDEYKAHGHFEDGDTYIDGINNMTEQLAFAIIAAAIEDEI